MIPVLTKYHTSFRVDRSGLKLGPGTQVSILSLAQVPAADDYGNPGYDIVATVELRNHITAFPDEATWRCSGCDAKPSHELDADAMWHILENHGCGRIAFPGPGDAYGGDEFPIFGWTRTASYCLLCLDCTTAVESAVTAALQARKGAR